MMADASPYARALAELGTVFDRIDDAAVDRAVRAIADARHVSGFGDGRGGRQ